MPLVGIRLLLAFALSSAIVLICLEPAASSVSHLDVGVRAFPGLRDSPTTQRSPARSANTPCRPASPRVTQDRPDVVDGPQVHVVYLVARDFPDEHLDEVGVLHCSVMALNQWLAEQSGGLKWRFDVFAHRGRLLTDVTFIQSDSEGASFYSSYYVQRELETRGVFQRGKKYLTFVAADQGTLCGNASYPLLEGSDRANPWDGHGYFAQVYLFSDPACNARTFGIPGAPSWAEAIALHELIHTEGVAPLGAPHGCTVVEVIPAHICTPGLVLTEEAGIPLDPERVDLMYPFVTSPLPELVLDRDRDDYFGHSLPTRNLADSPFLTN